MMIDTVIWWEPSQANGLAAAAPFLNVPEGVFFPADENWPSGYFRLDQMLMQDQFDAVDALADQHVCINCKRGPYPPGSPTGR